MDISKDKFLDFYNRLELEEKQELFKLYKTNNFDDGSENTYDKLSSILFKKRPPTPEEFLDPKHKWLPKAVTDSIYSHVKEDFINILTDNEKTFQVALYGGTRLGKSFLSRLLIIYTIIFIHHLREPAIYYKLSPLTDLAIYIISFKFDKTRQLYLKPIYKILEKSERFLKVTFQDKVAIEQEKYGCDKIVYSKASTVGEITLSSGLQIVLGNDDPTEFIGADVIQCYVSEISFFIEKAGASEDQIFRIYTDVYDRIEATVGRENLAFLLLDSSANLADSRIEQHIVKNLQYEPNCYFRWRSRWEARPYAFPKWQKAYIGLIESGAHENNIDKMLLKQGMVFQVITGDGAIQAKIVTDSRQLKDVPRDLIINVPIDVKKQFEDNLTTSIKNIAGRPTSSEAKFIQNDYLIVNMFDNPTLQNIEGLVEADSSMIPERYIWNKVFEQFFTKFNGKDYIIKRASREPRYIGVDLAFSVKGDIAGITVLHKEWSNIKNRIMYIVDFSFVIGAGANGINLEAIQHFIKDICYIGGISVSKGAVDTFQSQNLIQFSKRHNIDFVTQSVDADINPYLFLLTNLLEETIKSGKNIFLKNNLRALQKVKHKGNDKIDHTEGITNNKYFGDWEESTCGQFAKDCSDSLVQALYLAHLDEAYRPTIIYENENNKFIEKPKTLALTNLSTNPSVLDGYSVLHKYY